MASTPTALSYGQDKALGTQVDNLWTNVGVRWKLSGLFQNWLYSTSRSIEIESQLSLAYQYFYPGSLWLPKIVHLPEIFFERWDQIPSSIVNWHWRRWTPPVSAQTGEVTAVCMHENIFCDIVSWCNQSWSENGHTYPYSIVQVMIKSSLLFVEAEMLLSSNVVTCLILFSSGNDARNASLKKHQLLGASCAQGQLFLSCKFLLT